MRAVVRASAQCDGDEEEQGQALTLVVAPAVLRACITRLETEIDDLEPERAELEEGLQAAIEVLRSMCPPTG